MKNILILLAILPFWAYGSQSLQLAEVKCDRIYKFADELNKELASDEQITLSCIEKMSGIPGILQYNPRVQVTIDSSIRCRQEGSEAYTLTRKVYIGNSDELRAIKKILKSSYIDTYTDLGLDMGNNSKYFAHKLVFPTCI